MRINEFTWFSCPRGTSKHLTLIVIAGLVNSDPFHIDFLLKTQGLLQDFTIIMIKYGGIDSIDKTFIFQFPSRRSLTDLIPVMTGTGEHFSAFLLILRRKGSIPDTRIEIFPEFSRLVGRPSR